MSVNMKNWQELKKPNSLDVKAGGDKQRKATFVAEPLERGYGLTLGNALRRVLLSSLQGAAITSIRIENVLHEFSSLAGVREDVTDIVLNVKQIALKMEGEGPKRLQLSKTGPGAVTAGDIAVTGDIEVMNKSLVICHLDEGATLNMELTADTGKGYAPAVANRPVDAPIDSASGVVAPQSMSSRPASSSTSSTSVEFALIRCPTRGGDGGYGGDRRNRWSGTRASLPQASRSRRSSADS